jgi:predicted DNA-binding transcriptional regulator AlpA
MSEKAVITTAMLKAGRVGKLELSRRLNVSVKTIIKWLEEGTLPPQYRLGTIDFWTEEQIAHWLAQQNLPENYDFGLPAETAAAH